MGITPHNSSSLIFSGNVYITNYRVVLSTSMKHNSKSFDDHQKILTYFKKLSVPLASISKVTPIQAKNELQLVCKDLRFLHIYLPTGTKIEAYASFLQDVSFVGLNSSKLFAFNYMCSIRDVNEWAPCDIRGEYLRQGITIENNWQIYDNQNGSISDTYPQYLALPLESNFGIDKVMVATKFRSKGRLPVITFRCAETGAVLTRSSQPMVGITQKSCPVDEALLNLYRMKGLSPSSSSR